MSDWDLEETLKIFESEGLTRDEALRFLTEKPPTFQSWTVEKQQAATRAWHRIREREDQERVG